MRLDSEPKNGDYVSYVDALMRQYALEDAAKDHSRPGFPTAPAPASSRSATNRISTETEAVAPTLTRLPGAAQKLIGNALLLIAALLLVTTVLTSAALPLLPFLVFAFFVGGQILRSNAKDAGAVIPTPD